MSVDIDADALQLAREMSAEDRLKPLVYHGGRNYLVVFKAKTQDLVTGALTVFAPGFTDAELAMAIMDFTLWWGRDVLPRLNGFQGWDCIEWRIER